MDNYPPHLAPDFNESGAVVTPFPAWWARVRDEFPNVPEEVAQYWAHEHWSHSPYRWLPSKEYIFERCDWNAANLFSVRSRWCDWATNNAGCIAHGEYLIETLAHSGYKTSRYMLDNRDNHFSQNPNNIRDKDAPAEFLLIEGHRRFNMALYLLTTTRFKPTTTVWMMRHI